MNNKKNKKNNLKRPVQPQFSIPVPTGSEMFQFFRVSGPRLNWSVWSGFKNFNQKLLQIIRNKLTVAKRNDGKRMDGTVSGGKEVFLGCCQPVTIAHLIIRKSWCSNSGHNFRFSFYMFMDLLYLVLTCQMRKTVVKPYKALKQDNMLEIVVPLV